MMATTAVEVAPTPCTPIEVLPPPEPTVCNETLQTVPEPSEMTDDQLADHVQSGMKKLRELVPYVIELHARFQDGQRDSSNRLITPIRDCRTFTEFCINRCHRAPQVIYEAMRNSLAKKKGQSGNGGRKGSKSSLPAAPQPQIEASVSLEAQAASVEKARDEAFEQGRQAERKAQSLAAKETGDAWKADFNKRDNALRCADEFALAVASSINKSGTVSDAKMLAAARKAAIKYCKLRGILLSQEPKVPS